jgi:hypothetical protein
MTGMCANDKWTDAVLASGAMSVMITDDPNFPGFDCDDDAECDHVKWNDVAAHWAPFDTFERTATVQDKLDIVCQFLVDLCHGPDGVSIDAQQIARIENHVQDLRHFSNVAPAESTVKRGGTSLRYKISIGLANLVACILVAATIVCMYYATLDVIA